MRDNRIRLRNLRLTEAEDEALKARAEGYGLDVSKYIRAMAIGEAPGRLAELSDKIPAADLVMNVLAGTSDADAELIRRAAVGTDAERADLLAALVAHAFKRNHPANREWLRAMPEAPRQSADYFSRIIDAARGGMAPRDALRKVPFTTPEQPHPDWRAQAELHRRERDADVREGLVPGPPSDLSRMTPDARAIFEQGAAILAAEGR